MKEIFQKVGGLDKGGIFFIGLFEDKRMLLNGKFYGENFLDMFFTGC